VLAVHRFVGEIRYECPANRPAKTIKSAITANQVFLESFPDS